MTASVQLYLCRHGQSLWNQHGVLQGQLDSPLSILGQQQASELGIKAQDWCISHIVNSTLGRATHTAEICAQRLGLTNNVILGLEERHFGQWQGENPNNIQGYADFCQQRYNNTQLKAGHSGESTEQVTERMQQALMSLAQQHSGANILVISHGDALACLMKVWAPVTEIANIAGFQLTYRKQQLHWAGLLV